MQNDFIKRQMEALNDPSWFEGHEDSDAKIRAMWESGEKSPKNSNSPKA